MARVTFRTRPYARGASGRSILEYRWNGQKVIEQLTLAANRALQRATDEAYAYWREQVWTASNHPYMTGTERDAGRFIVFAGGDRLRPRLVGWVDLQQEYPLYEEFGTTYREGHFPLRRTMDVIAPRIRELMDEEMRAEARGAA